MVNNLEIELLYKKKLNTIKKHNKLYFTNDSPEISDAEYDKIKLELIELKKKYPFLKKVNSVSQLIGAKPSNKFQKIKHIHPMLSLANAFNKSDMNDFVKKVRNFLNYREQKIELISEN